MRDRRGATNASASPWKLPCHRCVRALPGGASQGFQALRPGQRWAGAGQSSWTIITWDETKGQYSGFVSETPSSYLLRHPRSRCINRRAGGTCHVATNLESIAPPGQLWAPCSARSSTNPTSARWRRCYGALWTQQNPPERHQPGPAEISAWACVAGGPGAIRAAFPVAQLQVAALADWTRACCIMYYCSVAVLAALIHYTSGVPVPCAS